MTQDKANYLIGGESTLSTQEAANILDVSITYLEKLLEEEKIPFTKIGVHQQICLNDLLAYQKRRREERKHAIEEIANISQELGLY
jgi:excisionase family DNA binding protein